jgi:hypothetical protein
MLFNIFSGMESLDVYKTDFRIDAWAPFAERAVTALLESAEKALRDKCNGNTGAICFQYRNNTSYVRLVLFFVIFCPQFSKLQISLF